MIHCTVCGVGTITESVLPQYVVPSLALSVVVVGAAIAKICDKCGHQFEITFPDPCGLMAAAAVARVQYPLKLSGGEIKFVRKAMCVSAKDMATKLYVTPETYSRWENDKAPMSPSHEKLFRAAACLELGEQAPGVDVDLLEILKMKFKSIRSSDSPVSLCFEWAVVKVNNNKSERKYAKAA